MRDIAGLRLLRLGPEARADWPLACRVWADDLGMDALAETALRLDPENPRVWLLRGRSAWLSGWCAEAAEVWQRAVTLAPHDRTAWLFYLPGPGGCRVFHPVGRPCPERGEMGGGPGVV